MKTTKPSATAIFVANGLWWVGNHKQLSAEITSPMTTFNTAMINHINTGIFSPRTTISRWFLHIRTALMQKISLPGFYLHFVVRKRAIEDMVQEAIHRHGASQLVIIGAGFDTLSLRMASQTPELSIIEIDHPATQSLKQTALATIHSTNKNIHLIPLDLMSHTMAEMLLQSSHYDAKKTTVFVAEGLIMYLSEKEMLQMLSFIHEHSGEDSVFVFTYMEEQKSGVFQFEQTSWATRFWLFLKNERFTWGLKSSQVSDFLSKANFRLLRHTNHQYLRDTYISQSNKSTPLVKGENIVAAQKQPTP